MGRQRKDFRMLVSKSRELWEGDCEARQRSRHETGVSVLLDASHHPADPVSSRSPSSCHVPAVCHLEKADHHAHCETEMLKGLQSIKAEHIWKVSLELRGRTLITPTLGT